MLVKISTDKTVSETAAALQAAVQANHFGVMQVHNLKETMAKKGVDFARECLIFEVCQPQQAKKVLDENMSVSTALPCRISIYEEGGKTILATLKPTALLAMFNAPQLEGVAQEVEATIVKIMKEAATGSSLRMNELETKQMAAPIENDWGSRSQVQILLLMVATAIGIYLCYRLTAPFLPALAWALALAVLFTPFQRWLESKLKYSSLAAVVSVLVIGLIVVVPATFVGQRLVLQAAKGAELIEMKVQSGELRRALEAQPRLAPLADRIERHIDLPGTVKTLTTWLSTIAGSIVKGSVFQVIGFCLTFYLLFFLLRDRHAVLQSLRYLSPLSEATMDRMFDRVGETIFATIYGTLAVSSIQGLLGGLMFWWLGLSTPLLWGVVMALLAVVPVLGAFVVWIPAVLILALEGSWGKALILTLWGMIVVGTIDNLFRPILVGKRLKLHTVLAFMSVVGGLILFGPAGLILGPVILTVTTVLLEIWSHRTTAEEVVRGEPDELSIFKSESAQRLLSQVTAVFNKLSKK